MLTAVWRWGISVAHSSNPKHTGAAASTGYRRRSSEQRRRHTQPLFRLCDRRRKEPAVFHGIPIPAMPNVSALSFPAAGAITA